MVVLAIKMVRSGFSLPRGPERQRVAALGKAQGVVVVAKQRNEVGILGRAPGLCRGVNTCRLGWTLPCQCPLDPPYEPCSRLNFSRSLQV